MVSSIVMSVFFFPLIGRLSDSISPQKMILSSFSLRIVAILTFMPIQDPTSIYTSILLTAIIVCTMAENVILDALFAKNLPRNIRGTLNGFMNAAGNIGILVFVKSAGWAFDIIGPKSPFMIVAAFDFMFLILVSGLICCGKFKSK